MKANTLFVVLMWALVLGVLAWRFGGTGAIESLAADLGCPGGECFLSGTTTPPDGRATLLPWPPKVGEPAAVLGSVDQTGPRVLASPSVGPPDRARPRRRSVSDVEAAYRAIPHRRTVFDVETAIMAPDERAFLRQMFDVVELGIVERVELLAWLQLRKRPAPSAENYESILSELNALSVPPRLENVHRLIADAMQEQRAALAEWRKTGVPADLAREPLVTSSSWKLRQAYAELLPLFPDEGEQNTSAFFDYLCAIDFI